MDVRRMEEDVLCEKIRTRHETQEHIQVYDCLFAPLSTPSLRRADVPAYYSISDSPIRGLSFRPIPRNSNSNSKFLLR